MVKAVGFQVCRSGKRRRGEEVREEEIMMSKAEILIKKGKKDAAAFVQAECMSKKKAANRGR